MRRQLELVSREKHHLEDPDPSPVAEMSAGDVLIGLYWRFMPPEWALFEELQIDNDKSWSEVREAARQEMDEEMEELPERITVRDLKDDDMQGIPRSYRTEASEDELALIRENEEELIDAGYLGTDPDLPPEGVTQIDDENLWSGHIKEIVRAVAEDYADALMDGCCREQLEKLGLGDDLIKCVRRQCVDVVVDRRWDRRREIEKRNRRRLTKARRKACAHFRRIDLFALNLRSKTPDLRAIEIKVDYQDFKQEIENPQKRSLPHRKANQFIYAVPKGLVQKEEVPDDCGLINVFPSDKHKCGYGTRWVKKAPVGEAEPPSWDLVRRLCRKAMNTVRRECEWMPDPGENKTI